MPQFSDCRQLRESTFAGNGVLKVDREKGIIYGVKLVGLESSNDHGMPGATNGTKYTPAALIAAIPLYEGKASNKNHTFAKANPQDSDPDKRLGWATNVHFVEGQGLFGDYHVLLSDPFAAKLMEAAEKNPRLFAVSHDAYGKGRVVDGWFVIDQIKHVESLDVVADGGTNVSLLESRQGRQPMKSTFRKLLETRSAKNRKVKAFFGKSHVQRLLEMDGLGETLMDEPAPEEDEAKGWRALLGDLLKGIVEDESLQPDDIKSKLNTALKLLETGEKPEGEAKLDESEDKEKEKEGDGKKKDDEEGETKESLAAKVKRFEQMADVRKLCEARGLVNATQDDIESIAAMPTATKREWLIDTIKAGKTQPQAPQSQGAHVKESAGNPQRQPGQEWKPLLRA